MEKIITVNTAIWDDSYNDIQLGAEELQHEECRIKIFILLVKILHKLNRKLDINPEFYYFGRRIAAMVRPFISESSKFGLSNQRFVLDCFSTVDEIEKTYHYADKSEFVLDNRKLKINSIYEYLFLTRAISKINSEECILYWEKIDADSLDEVTKGEFTRFLENKGLL